MAQFSKTSKKKLGTAHEDLQTIFNDVIKYFDCTIIYGHRTPEEQNILYQQGRTKPGSIVTYLDGYTKKSKHNEYPSHAIDVVPWFAEMPHIRWKDKETLYYFAGFVKGIASKLYEEGKISHELHLGADWSGDNDVNDESFIDIVHFEIK